MDPEYHPRRTDRARSAKGPPDDPAKDRDAANRPPWKDIHDYGVIGNLTTAALIARDGGIEWACFPSFSSPSVFGQLLDRARGGCHRIVVDGAVGSFQRYSPGTNVLRTFLTTRESAVTVTDWMPLPPNADRPAPPRILRRLDVTGPPVSVT
ncbi:MAG TPA: trehalase-like domain-containing protein, partial [Thermoplasmata archaeon]